MLPSSTTALEPAHYFSRSLDAKCTRRAKGKWDEVVNYSAGELDARAICAIMPEDLAYREYGSKPIQARQKRTSSVGERARAPAADRLYLQFPLILHSVPWRLNPLSRELARAFSVPRQHEGHSGWVYPNTRQIATKASSRAAGFCFLSTLTIPTRPRGRKKYLNARALRISPQPGGSWR